MHDLQSISHIRWDCKYHIVIISKFRKRVIYGNVWKRIGGIIRDLCRQKRIELLEGPLMPFHIHMCLSVPLKFSIAFVIDFLKGKSAIRIHREVLGNKRVTGIASARLAWMKKLSENTFANKRRSKKIKRS